MFANAWVIQRCADPSETAADMRQCRCKRNAHTQDENVSGSDPETTMSGPPIGAPIGPLGIQIRLGLLVPGQ